MSMLYVKLVLLWMQLGIRSPIESLDTEILLYPFEKQFHLPATPIQIYDDHCWQRKVVGQKHQGFVCYGIVIFHPAEFVWIVLALIESSEHDWLIADQGGTPVYLMRINSAAFEVGLGADNEKGAVLGNGVQPRKVQLPAIHDVKRSGFQGQDIQGVDLVELAVWDVNESRDIAPKIQQGVQFDRSLGPAEAGPGEHW
jgi:hypothetical protein